MPRPSPRKTSRYRSVAVLAAALLATTGLASAASAGTVSPHAARIHTVHIQAGGAAAALRAAHAVHTSTATRPDTTSLCPDAKMAPFGNNVCVFTPSMSQTDIQNDLNAIATQQVPVGSQFDSNRYAIYFEPGTYGSADNPLVFQVGYYTEVAGLGLNPGDTTVDGAIDVFNNLCTAGTSDCNSDDNFWRSLSNLTLNVDLPSSPPTYAPPVQDPYGTGCTNSAEIWSASQASPIRRVDINGNVVLQDYCAADNYASGGFIADSEISGDLDFYGNQQYMVRNSSIGGASGCPDGLWNMVYSGVTGAPDQVFTGQCEQNTVLATSPVTEEEPFLYLNTSTGKFEVFVPAVQTNTSGTSWGNGTEAGTSIPLYRFLVAYPTTSVSAMNAALAKGKNLLLTPGVYNTSQSIDVSKADTVVLAQGFATLVPQQGNVAMTVESAKGVKLSGLIIDAGPVNSPALLQLENRGLGASDPDLVQDVFFRIGGAETTATHATVSLLDAASNSIIDDVWAWRADHGNDVGWTDNTGATGLKVTGNNVTAYGLAVEHYQKDEVIWTGQGGTDVFFQNELPYDPPSQADWQVSASQPGYPAFDVGQKVSSFQGYGMGSYVVFIDTSATLYDAEPFEAPTAPGVQFTDVFGVWIAGSGGDNSIIDGTGGPDNSTTPGNQNPVDVTSYPGS